MEIWCFNVCKNVLASISLLLCTDPRRLEATVSRSMSAQVSLMRVRLATELQSTTSVLELVPNEPGFNKVGTVLAAVCWLLLEAPECRGKLRSSEAVIVASYSCWNPMFLVGRLIGVCSLADIDAELWAHNMCLEADRPDGQTVHPTLGSRTGLV